MTLIQEEHLWADGGNLTPISHLITREGERSTFSSSHVVAMGITGWVMNWSQSTLDGYYPALFGSQTPFIQHFDCHSLESVIMSN